MSKKFLIIFILIVLVVGAGGFYGGMRYQQYANQKRFTNLRGQNGDQLPSFGSGRAGNRNGGGFVAGSITAKDDKSITVKTQDGSSKIVYFSDSTTIAKSVSGSSSDLSIGANVTVDGTSNSDNSVTAQNIQIRNQ